MGEVVSLSAFRAARAQVAPPEPMPRHVAPVAREVLRTIRRRWPAPSDWQGQRVFCCDSLQTGRVVGWDSVERLFIVEIAPGVERLASVAVMERIPGPPQPPKGAA